MNVDDVVGVATACEGLSYYLHLRLVAKSEGAELTLPPAVESIAALMAELPVPDEGPWAGLSIGKLPAKAKPGAAPKPAAAAPAAPSALGEEVEASVKRARTQWTDESKAELVRLVEDEAYRTEALGKDGSRGGHLNWAALARHFGFSGTAPLHRQYHAMTGKEAPHAVRPKKEAAGEAGEAQPAAKKPKTEAPTAPATAAPSDGWTAEQGARLVRLVEDEAFRKATTGKRKLRWSRLAEALDKGKKDCKKKYAALTGKAVAEDE